MESINVMIVDAATPSVPSADDEENSSIPSLVKTDVLNTHSDMCSKANSKSPMEANQSIVE